MDELFHPKRKLCEEWLTCAHTSISNLSWTMIVKGPVVFTFGWNIGKDLIKFIIHILIIICLENSLLSFVMIIYNDWNIFGVIIILKIKSNSYRKQFTWIEMMSYGHQGISFELLLDYIQKLIQDNNKEIIEIFNIVWQFCDQQPEVSVLGTIKPLL